MSHKLTRMLALFAAVGALAGCGSARQAERRLASRPVARIHARKVVPLLLERTRPTMR
jgi:hypothetical protein